MPSRCRALARSSAQRSSSTRRSWKANWRHRSILRGAFMICTLNRGMRNSSRAQSGASPMRLRPPSRNWSLFRSSGRPPSWVNSWRRGSHNLFDQLGGTDRTATAEAKVKTADGQWHPFKGTWRGRYILDGYAISDEYRMTDLSGKLIGLGLNLRAYDASKQTWNIKWLNALTGTWMDLAPSEVGPVMSDGQSMPSKRWRQSIARTRIRAPLTRKFPRRISLGEERSRRRGMPGASSWPLSAIAAGGNNANLWRNSYGVLVGLSSTRLYSLGG